MLVLITLVWGTNWPLFAFAVREVSVWTFRAVAVTIAGLSLLAVARWGGAAFLLWYGAQALLRASRPQAMGYSADSGPRSRKAVLLAADRACFVAKRRGRGRVATASGG